MSEPQDPETTDPEGPPPPVYPPASVPTPEEEADPSEEVGLPEGWPVTPPTD